MIIQASSAICLFQPVSFAYSISRTSLGFSQSSSKDPWALPSGSPRATWCVSQRGVSTDVPFKFPRSSAKFLWNKGLTGKISSPFNVLVLSSIHLAILQYFEPIPNLCERSLSYFYASFLQVEKYTFSKNSLTLHRCHACLVIRSCERVLELVNL